MVPKILNAMIVCSILSAFLGTLCGGAYSQEYYGTGDTVKFAAGNWMAHGTTLTGPNISEFQIPPLPPDAVVDYRRRVCENHCWQNEHCMGWTYQGAALTQPSHCYLKGFPFPNQVQNPSFDSGGIGEPNTNREGHDYKHQAALSPQECVEECGSTANCMAWTFVEHKEPRPEGEGVGICELKDGIPAPEVKQGCTSGYFIVEKVNPPAP